MPLAFLPSPARSAWHLGPLPLRAQALFVVAGIVLAIVIADRRYRAAGGCRGVIVDVAAWAVPVGLIPAGIGALLSHAQPGAWEAIRTWDSVIGLPGAVAFGAAGAWLGCRQARRIAGRRRTRVKLAQVADAVAPAILFGNALAAAGTWFSQSGYGRPSSLWWAVEISPARRPPGLENFATFQPVFMYQALWDVAAGIAVLWAARRLGQAGMRAFALACGAYGAGGFSLYWLGIAHSPAVLGVRAGALGDAVLVIAAVAYLARARRRRSTSSQVAGKVSLERSRPVM